MNQELFLRRATKVHVPVGSGGATRAQVASAIQEIAAFHCILSESVIERIGMLSADELARWLRDMLGVLRRRVGARAAPAVLSGLPEQVLKASKAELYLTAVMHYLTLRRLPAHEHARPPLLEGKLVPWLIELGRVAEFESLLAPLVSSRTSLSEVDAADVAWFIRQYRGDVFRLLPGTCHSARSARWLAARWSSTWRAMRGWTNSWIATSRPRPTRCGWRWP